MRTELENLQHQVNTLEENTGLITQDIVRIMPTIASLLSENEKNMKEFHEIRTKDQELLHQIKTFIKRENEVLSKIVNDYGSLQDLAVQIVDATGKELAKLTSKEKEIVSKLAEIPDQVNVKHHYGIDLKSTPVAIIMLLLFTFISWGVGVSFEKNKQIREKTSYEYRYRMVGLDFPEFIQKIDSAFNKDESRFIQIVIKREEELRLINSIDQKRSEIQQLGQ